MIKFEQLWQRIIQFITTLFKTASTLATLLTILVFLGLSTATLGVKNDALVLTLIGTGVIILTGIIFILFHTMLRNIIASTLPEHATSKSSSAHSPVLGSATVSDEPNILSKTTAILSVVSKAETPHIDTISYPPPPPQEDVIILRKEIVYEYMTDGRTIYQRKHLKIQALQEGLASFRDRYRWTGKGTCDLSSLTENFVVTNIHDDYEGLWTYFDVKFPYPLHLGHEFMFTIQWKLVDEDNIALTFLSTMIDRETKYLLLQVSLPEELKPTRSTFHEFANYIHTLPTATEKVQWSPATKSIRYEVLEPRKDHKYLIRWYRD